MPLSFHPKPQKISETPTPEILNAETLQPFSLDPERKAFALILVQSQEKGGLVKPKIVFFGEDLGDACSRGFRV